MKPTTCLPLLALLPVLLFPAAASAQSAAYACTPIETLPTTITSPGTYCLVDSHTVNMLTGSSITIASNDVSLDCQNNTIRNTNTALGASSTAVIANKRNNVVVRNCRIVGGFRGGILLVMPLPGSTFSYYNVVEGNYIAGPLLWGIRAVGSALRIVRNEIYDIGGYVNGGAMGIQVVGNPDSLYKFHIVEGNIVAGTASSAGDAHAILAENAAGSVFRDNLVSGVYAPPGAYGYGIKVVDGVGVTFRDNHVGGAGNANEYGIFLTPTGNFPCYHNQVRVSLAPYTGCSTSNGNY